MTRPLCIYHFNCADGFAAAWAVRKFFNGEVDFHGGSYGQAPPDVTGRDVILVDFSYKRPVIEEMMATARSMLILDHHKTARDDLAGLAQPPSHEAWQTIRGDEHASLRIAAIFDMDRSGAMIAWNYFFKNKLPPQLLRHIQDRDLWLFKLEGTREIQANVFSYPYDFEIWDKLMASDPKVLIAEGAAIERKHHKDVAELVAVTWRKMVIGGHIVPVANMPYTLASDAGNYMCRGLQDTDGSSWIPPFAATYYDTDRHRKFSLRSTDAGVDVSEIGARYGGGGHRNASGFVMPPGWEGDAA